jgi:hypothetical protein
MVAMAAFFRGVAPSAYRNCYGTEMTGNVTMLLPMLGHALQPCWCSRCYTTRRFMIRYARRQLLICPDSVFDASLVPETCLDRLIDSRELIIINKFLE